jgi:hypothetical protein
MSPGFPAVFEERQSCHGVVLLFPQGIGRIVKIYDWQGILYPVGVSDWNKTDFTVVN